MDLGLSTVFYKQMICQSGAQDIVYTNLITGVHGNYLKASLVAAGLDPERLPESDPSQMNFGSDRQRPKAWKEIWGCGQGIGVLEGVAPAEALVARLEREYREACQGLRATLG